MQPFFQQVKLRSQPSGVRGRIPVVTVPSLVRLGGSASSNVSVKWREDGADLVVGADPGIGARAEFPDLLGSVRYFSGGPACVVTVHGRTGGQDIRQTPAHNHQAAADALMAALAAVTFNPPRTAGLDGLIGPSGDLRPPPAGGARPNAYTLEWLGRLAAGLNLLPKDGGRCLRFELDRLRSAFCTHPRGWWPDAPSQELDHLRIMRGYIEWVRNGGEPRQLDACSAQQRRKHFEVLGRLRAAVAGEPF